MKTTKSTPGTAAAPLVHWLMLIAGLALVTVQRIDHLDTVVPLWIGAVVGTAVGQLMGRRRLRLWLALAAIANLMWMLPLASLPVWGWIHGMNEMWSGLETAELAFAPAALCGYLSLGERATLAVFWFPAVLWMMAILDRSGSVHLQGTVSWILLAGSSALLLASLYTREARRIALWRGYATVRLAAPRSGAVLRRAPLRSAGQLAWATAVGALSLAITAWIAPLLWQTEDTGTALESTSASAASGGTAGPAEPCCPDGSGVVVRRTRVREYFPLLSHQDTDHYGTPTSYCSACRDGVPIGSADWKGGPGHVASAGGTSAGDPQYIGGPGGFAPHVEPGAADTYLAPTGATAVVQPTPPAHGTAAVLAAPPAVHGGAPIAQQAWSPGRDRAAMGRVRRVHRQAEADYDDPLPWLLTLAVTAVVVRLAMRPVRRWLLIRHLGRPFWAETVDQRVSNLWQLVLVGLRDAGWRAAPGEQPQELARRIGLEGMKTCATVLERARHGVRVDGEDLAAMTEAARQVYEGARKHAGGAARAAGWVRWPLV